jgi:hypothetical protein
MRKLTTLAIATAAVAVLAGCTSTPPAEPTGPMSFFISSTGSGKGADLGGLAGRRRAVPAPGHRAGAGAKTWRAYLSVPGAFPGANHARACTLVNARDRIGNGPWFNAQHQQGHRAGRKRQHRQRPRRHAQRARHPDRQPRRRHRLRAADRHHVQGAGPAAPTARPSSATTTASARCPTTGPRAGTSATSRPAAARRRWCAPAARAGCIALPRTERRHRP